MNSLDSPESVTIVNSPESSGNVTIITSLESLGNVTNMSSTESSSENVPSLPHELALPPTLLMSLVLLFYIPVGAHCPTHNHHFENDGNNGEGNMTKDMLFADINGGDTKKHSQIILTAATGSLLLIASVNIFKYNLTHQMINCTTLKFQ